MEDETFLRSLDGQRIPCILMKWKVYWCVHKCLPLVYVVSQMNPVRALERLFFKIHLNIIFQALINEL